MSTYCVTHMFNFLPAIKLNGGKVEIDLFDHRQDDKQHNVDFVRVVTYDDDGNNPMTTQLGIQGQSDHLAEVMQTRREQTAAKASDTVTEGPAPTVDPVSACAEVALNAPATA